MEYSMRIKPVVQVEYYEDIISYECNYPGKFVKILVGTGTLSSDGEFVPNSNQNYEPIIVDYDNFQELMSATDIKPQNVFRKDDLWVHVDRVRQRAKEEQDLFINRVVPAEIPVETPVKSVRK